MPIDVEAEVLWNRRLSPGYNALARDLDHAGEFLHRYSERLLFGTDLLTRGQELPIVAFLRDFGLEGEDWENISHANAERLLNLA